MANQARTSTRLKEAMRGWLFAEPQKRGRKRSGLQFTRASISYLTVISG